MTRVISTKTLGKVSRSGDPVSAMVVSALIGAGGAAYSANEANKQQKEAEAARRRAEEKARREAMDARPEGESATMLPGTGDNVDTSKGYNEFLSPKLTSSALGGTGSDSGIRTGKSSGLGFNV